MIPCLAMVQVGRRANRLWLPLFLLWPFVPLLVLILVVAGLVLARTAGSSKAHVLRTTWQLVSGWRGLRIEVDSPDAVFQIRFI